MSRGWLEISYKLTVNTLVNHYYRSFPHISYRALQKVFINLRCCSCITWNVLRSVTAGYEMVGTVSTPSTVHWQKNVIWNLNCAYHLFSYYTDNKINARYSACQKHQQYYLMQSIYYAWFSIIWTWLSCPTRKMDKYHCYDADNCLYEYYLYSDMYLLLNFLSFHFHNMLLQLMIQ